MNIEQERAFIEWRTNHDPRKYPAERDAFMAGWDAGRAALQSQDREDAERYRWLRQHPYWPEENHIFDSEELDAAIDHALRVEGEGE